MSRVSIRAIAQALDKAEPRVGASKLAGVSVILDDSEILRTLLIKRAEREGDPWSGQVAFPGGKMNQDDESALKAAIRETMEEVGVDLGEDATLLGYFGSFRTHTGAMDVIPAVFLLKERVEVVPNPEVSSYRWVELDSFQPGSRSTFAFGEGLVKREMPAYVIGDYVIWGLTLRMIEALLERARR